MTTRSKTDIRQYTSEIYCLTFLTDRPFVNLDSPKGDRLAELFVLSSIHSLGGRDDTIRIGEWEVDEQPNVTTFTLRAESSLWKAKRYRFQCFPSRFTYDVQVEGDGQLAEVNYFGGYYSGQPRWGSGFFWSGQHFLSIFNPEPNMAEVKRIKSDALIMTHTPHPYLEDVVDMMRLNDINTGADVNQEMTHRARVASIACLKLSIDTDNWLMPDKAAWHAYMGRQLELGVRSLYFVTHIDSTGEPLDAEDYRLIRETWARYREQSNLAMSNTSGIPSILSAEG